MKRLVIAFILLPELIFAQTYKQLTDSALHVMWSARDTNVLKVYSRSLALYQEAFRKYPTETESVALYKAGSIECELGHKREAFNYLQRYVDKNLWDAILYPDARSEFVKLISDPEWDKLVKKAKGNKERFLRPFELKQQMLEKEEMLNTLNLTDGDALLVYRRIKAYDHFPKIAGHYISMRFPINDRTTTTYLICMPRNYNQHKSYPLMFSLHGGVQSNTGFPDFMDSLSTGGLNRFYTKYAWLNNVIMVYPSGNQKYNWMYPDDGFFMVPAILRQIKQIINIDDNRVFITGHSNGATGSFSYLMKQPSSFAAFYGFNTRPKVATGGTYIRNILNRSYFNVSTDSDYYYPPEANDSLSATMKRMEADYQDHRYNGFPHWFPQFDESEGAHRLLFDDLAKRKRNPFHADLYWECDDIKYGRGDWVQINLLDTINKPASWQKNLNFSITKWKAYGPKHQLITRDTLINAFKYSKKSGAIKAHYSRNVFTVTTSEVKSFSLLLSPQMVDFRKPVTVVVNGNLYRKQMPRYDKDYMIQDFKKNADRSALWVSTIKVTLY